MEQLIYSFAVHVTLNYPLILYHSYAKSQRKKPQVRGDDLKMESNNHWTKNWIYMGENVI